MIVSGRRSALAQCAFLVIGLLLFCAILDTALAQPFGVARGAAQPEIGGFAGWILHKQAEFYRMLSGLIRAAKADGSAAYTLLGVSFLYGIFHAAGPGHGKAVISSYLVANNETWRRGVVLSFASAILQAFTAVAIVGIAAAMLGATAKAMGDTVRVIEIVSYALIVLIGLRLLWVKGRAFLRLLRGSADAGPSHEHAHKHAHDHHHGHNHDHNHDHSHDHDHDHDHDHHHHGHAHAHDHHDHGDEASAWGHAHAPEPQELTGRHWFRRGLSAIVAVGLRPCSGAIIVLVFALAQGLFWIGVASTFLMGLGTAITVAAIATLAVGARGLAGRLAKAKPGVGMLLIRGLETAAALVIVLFGTALLTGYMVSERLMGV
ncbi:MAG TPA: nickel/cobalt transporter [Pseudolabrys sp.]|jgi:nickel/cobalt exporter|nr:nickel/cobalt transporter [Pseudolabrys sp.]